LRYGRNPQASLERLSDEVLGACYVPFRFCSLETFVNPQVSMAFAQEL
jgi:hypothetical protein